MAMIDIEAQDSNFQQQFEELMYIASQIRDLGESIAWQEEEAEIDSDTFDSWRVELRDLQDSIGVAIDACNKLKLADPDFEKDLLKELA